MKKALLIAIPALVLAGAVGALIVCKKACDIKIDFDMANGDGEDVLPQM